MANCGMAIEYAPTCDRARTDDTAQAQLIVATDADPSSLPRIACLLQSINAVPQEMQLRCVNDDELLITFRIAGLGERAIDLLVAKIGQMTVVRRVHAIRPGGLPTVSRP